MPVPAHRPGPVHAPYTWAGATCWIGGVVARGDPLDSDHPHRHYEFVRVMLYVGSAYFVALAGLKAMHDRRQRRRAVEAATTEPSSAAEAR